MFYDSNGCISMQPFIISAINVEQSKEKTVADQPIPYRKAESNSLF